ncbi:LexA DNA-binding domain protein [Pyrolobus fumarii 1A]|uniref:LexA DNA-binding domain protein n=1 Tax=Pyrolobus fumarii (strain DSM 11204 / 1A) TaxID=694429 RepID=G0EHD6_PYRF1|nr:helix-turn-helix domain-containing protein [Pyrolobus fumarii]AEM38511.1 LexA DNA-binding domain protein [Pyrolobus fumarii 1A]
MTGQKQEHSEDPIAALGGTALRVYLYLLSHGGPVTPRELQRAMGFRSVSTAYHHLERLAGMGLVEKRGDGYVARKPSGLLGLYMRLYGRLVPRMLIAASISSGVALGYTLSYRDPLAAILLWLVSALFWREVITLKAILMRLCA